MIAKLVVWGPNRQTCIRRLKRALAEFMLTGVKTNIVLHKNILEHPSFLDGSYTTQFLDNQMKDREQKQLFMFVDEHVFLISAAITAYIDSKSRNIGEFNIASRWKELGRSKGMRV